MWDYVARCNRVSTMLQGVVSCKGETSCSDQSATDTKTEKKRGNLHDAVERESRKTRIKRKRRKGDSGIRRTGERNERCSVKRL